jgi:hypothetical protein
LHSAQSIPIRLAMAHYRQFQHRFRPFFPLSS